LCKKIAPLEANFYVDFHPHTRPPYLVFSFIRTQEKGEKANEIMIFFFLKKEEEGTQSVSQAWFWQKEIRLFPPFQISSCILDISLLFCSFLDLCEERERDRVRGVYDLDFIILSSYSFIYL